MKATINKYSIYDNYTVRDNGTNYSAIVTKMVQLSGRLCERFASDIIYDANAFISSIKLKENFDRYLFFRENGVTDFKPEDVDCIEGTDFIQVWHLTYDADTQDQEFTRVYITFKGDK